MMPLADLTGPHRRPRSRPWARVRRRAAAAVIGAFTMLILFANAVYGGDGKGVETIRVRPGDTVWSIAAQHYRDSSDLRAAVDEITTVNHLQNGAVVEGQTLTLPPG